MHKELKDFRMTNTRRNTAYCGLYCLDCIPSNKKLFHLLSELEKNLEDLNFENYAKLKSNRSRIFYDYPVFINVLREIKKLECSSSCRDGPSSTLGCRKNCAIRLCATGKGYEGCWQCDNYKKCQILSDLEINHPYIKKI
jgi:hypothetical protein